MKEIILSLFFNKTYLIMKRAFYEAVVVVMVSVFFSIAVNGIRPERIDLFSNNYHKNDKYKNKTRKEITIEDAIRKYKSGNALFIDARPEIDFSKGHIKGAINRQESNFDKWVNDFISKTASDKLIITYCDGIDCQLSKNLAEKLELVGFENVYYMTDGWNKWNQLSQPIASGRNL
ncbi:MAG TPA: rhodanese-like domain-containing protein [Desulfobacteraceae bacterium]|nr:rhodanese-like domain-containing protein [Desulfobacteraceae bacterium]